MEKLWTAAQTADYLHVSKYTIYKWLAQGKLQRSKAGGRTLIREAEIMNLIEDGAPPRKLRRSTDAAAAETSNAKA